MTDSTTRLLEDDLLFIASGNTTDPLNFSVKGSVVSFNDLRFVVSTLAELTDDLLFIADGKTYEDAFYLAYGKSINDLGFCVLGTESYKRRVGMLDTLKLRNTFEYSAPRDFQYLQLVYGDLTSSQVPCIPMDSLGYKWLLSDRASHSVMAVYVNEQPITYGYQIYTKYIDEVGKATTIIEFTYPQYTNSVTASCRGITKNNVLIENPADFVYDILINVQQYDADVINYTNLAEFRAVCNNYGIKIASVITTPLQLRELFDMLSLNTWSNWLISDGKQNIRLRRALL